MGLGSSQWVLFNKKLNNIDLLALKDAESSSRGLLSLAATPGTGQSKDGWMDGWNTPLMKPIKAAPVVLRSGDSGDQASTETSLLSIGSSVVI